MPINHGTLRESLSIYTGANTLHQKGVRNSYVSYEIDRKCDYMLIDSKKHVSLSVAGLPINHRTLKESLSIYTGANTLYQKGVSFPRKIAKWADIRPHRARGGKNVCG